MSISVCKFSYLHGNGRFLKSVFAPSLFSLPLVVGSCSLLSSFVRSSSKEREREKRNVSAHHHHQRRQQGKQKEREKKPIKKRKAFHFTRYKKTNRTVPAAAGGSCCASSRGASIFAKLAPILFPFFIYNHALLRVEWR